MKENKVCSVFGHRNIEINNELITRLTTQFENMIKEENFNTFYFGGYGDFDEFCHKIVSELKINYLLLKEFFVFQTLDILELIKDIVG